MYHFEGLVFLNHCSIKGEVGVKIELLKTDLRTEISHWIIEYGEFLWRKLNNNASNMAIFIV